LFTFRKYADEDPRNIPEVLDQQTTIFALFTTMLTLYESRLEHGRHPFAQVRKIQTVKERKKERSFHGRQLPGQISTIFNA
jgi:hypothetical protein